MFEQSKNTKEISLLLESTNEWREYCAVSLEKYKSKLKLIKIKLFTKVRLGVFLIAGQLFS